MKQIKAFVHRNRVTDLIHALEAAGFQRLSLFDVKGLLRALSAREQQYSVELGDKVINEIQMELFCEDDDEGRNWERNLTTIPPINRPNPRSATAD
ncbi:P-II family nitrogen regulator [Thermomonas sp.]|uniref:P-II family nitrogen regulator n=1 Tax=Thermomonas sp. TaxID=1971895 RepID=UPI002630C18B|nr:P-II family nitrogen regulator [Thermomonas sp.]MCO5055832.1 hypothetical protein [Thermomonas sp.]